MDKWKILEVSYWLGITCGSYAEPAFIAIDLGMYFLASPPLPARHPVAMTGLCRQKVFKNLVSKKTRLVIGSLAWLWCYPFFMFMIFYLSCVEWFAPNIVGVDILTQELFLLTFPRNAMRSKISEIRVILPAAAGCVILAAAAGRDSAKKNQALKGRCIKARRCSPSRRQFAFLPKSCKFYLPRQAQKSYKFYQPRLARFRQKRSNQLTRR